MDGGTCQRITKRKINPVARAKSSCVLLDITSFSILNESDAGTTGTCAAHLY
jgi:hypothetical protein